MLNIGLFSLICSLAYGVFGFGVDAPNNWTWEKSSCLFFLMLSAASFVAGTMSRQILVWDSFDEFDVKRKQNLSEVRLTT